MNAGRLKKLEAEVRIGGKGTPRRKKKVVHTTTTIDDKKLQTCLRNISVSTLPGIEEVNMIGEDGAVLHFTKPKLQASLAANTFSITGRPDEKKLTDLVPDIVSQLGPDGLELLKRMTGEEAIAAGSRNEAEDMSSIEASFDEDSDQEERVGSISKSGTMKGGKGTNKGMDKIDTDKKMYSKMGTKTDNKMKTNPNMDNKDPKDKRKQFRKAKKNETSVETRPTNEPNKDVKLGMKIESKGDLKLNNAPAASQKK